MIWMSSHSYDAGVKVTGPNSPDGTGFQFEASNRLFLPTFSRLRAGIFVL